MRRRQAAGRGGPRLQDSARGGVVARLCGDEFGLIIDGKQPEAGLALAAAAGEPCQGIPDRRQGGPRRRHHRHGGLPAQRRRRGLAARQCRRGAVPRQGRSRAARSASSSRRWTSRSAIAACCTGPLDGDQERRTVAALPAAGASGDTSPRARSSASRRWRAGSIRCAAWSRPAEFIPIAEESGLIVEMGEWILREACREAASWPKPLQIAVNLSPVQFRTATWSGWSMRSCSRPGLRPAGSSSKSPKAC